MSDFRMTWTMAARLIAGALVLSAGSLAYADSDEHKDEREDIHVARLDDLSFGEIVPGGVFEGTVSIDPANGAVTHSGGAVVLGGPTHRARFRISGEKDEVVSIFITPQTTLLGAGAAMDLSPLTTWPETYVTLDGGGQAIVTVGGTLRVGRTQQPGAYNGPFMVEAEYLYHDDDHGHD